MVPLGFNVPIVPEAGVTSYVDLPLSPSGWLVKDTDCGFLQCGTTLAVSASGPKAHLIISSVAHREVHSFDLRY